MSRAVANQVVSTLHLTNSPAAVLGSVTAVPTPNADFVDISAVQPTPKLAADVANAFARSFINLTSSQDRQSLRQALVQSERQLNAMPKNQASLSARQALDATIRELQLAISLPTAQAEQVDSAIPPTSPTSPHPVRSALYALALALVAAIALAFGLERFDRRIRDVSEAAEAYGLPLLAILPHTKIVAPPLGGLATMGRDFREPSRMLRASIQLSSLNKPIKSILVISAIAGEGKSTIVRNLAIAYRESGRRVVVVDADLRRPNLAKVFGLESERGVTSVLTGEHALADALLDVRVEDGGLATLAQMEATTGPNGRAAVPAAVTGGAEIVRSTDADPTLQVLASGPFAADPQAIFASRRTEALLGELKLDYDIVLIDSPPLLAVSDAVPLVGQVDAVLVVCRMGLSTHTAAQRLMEMLRRIPGTNPVGVVANDIKSHGDGAYYGYGRSAYLSD